VEASRNRLWSKSAVKPHSEYWEPVAPPDAERRHEEWRQALALAPTIMRMWRIAIEDFAPAQLDRHLRAFRGFHEDPDALEYRMRPWQKTRPNEAGPRDVVGIAPWQLALMFQIAMENEEPIPAYTRQSGEGFRFLLPALGRFMGTTREQARYLAEQGLPWCVGPWCAEEHRHSNTLARLIERVMGRPPRRDNPNQPIVVTSEEKAALEHLMSRQTTEWNASSSYLVMAAHSQGELHKIVRNLERDEVKHLAILGAVHCYLFGWQPWRRLWAVIRQGLANYGLQRQRRSGGRMLGANPVTAVEGIVAHLLTEFLVRRWLRKVPLRTLRAVFEAPSRLQALAASEAELGAAERIPLHGLGFVGRMHFHVLEECVRAFLDRRSLIAFRLRRHHPALAFDQLPDKLPRFPLVRFESFRRSCPNRLAAPVRPFPPLEKECPGVVSRQVLATGFLNADEPPEPALALHLPEDPDSLGDLHSRPLVPVRCLA
jgi:hypothetical protein